MPLPENYEPKVVLAKWFRKEHRINPWWNWIVWHDTEGSENATSAENGASYNTTRNDQVSCNAIVDGDSVVTCVPDQWVSFSAGAPANDMGLQLEICGKASQSEGEWMDPDDLLWNVAWQTAKWCKKYNIPARYLSADDLCDDWQQKGITTHWAITKAEQGKGENGQARSSSLRAYKLANKLTINNHTDPGPNFPIEMVLARTHALLVKWAGSLDPDDIPKPPIGDDFMILTPFIAVVNEPAVWYSPQGLTRRWIRTPIDLRNMGEKLGLLTWAEAWGTPGLTDSQIRAKLVTAAVGQRADLDIYGVPIGADPYAS